jgi:hypothetical protein
MAAFWQSIRQLSYSDVVSQRKKEAAQEKTQMYAEKKKFG